MWCSPLFFVLGAIAGPLLRPMVRPLLRGTIRGGMIVGRQIHSTVASIREDLEDLAAEARSEEYVEPGE